MKTLRTILLILFAVSVVTGAFFAVKQGLALRTSQVSLGEKEKRVEELREQIKEANFKYRGAVKGMGEVPDSLRASVTGEYVKKSTEYRKRLYVLERDHKEAERLMRKDQRAVAAARSILIRWLLVFGGAAVVLLTASLLAGRAIRS